MSKRLIVALLSSLVAAGCFGPQGSPPEDVAPPAIVPWELRDCAFFSARAPVPAERVAPYMPAGYTPDADGSGNVGFGLRAWLCASGAGLDNESVAPVSYASLSVHAHAPEGLLTDPEAGTFVKWRVLVPDAPRRDALRALGVDAVAGDVTVESLAGTTVVTARLDGEGVFTLRVLPGMGEAATFEGEGFDEFSPLAGGGVSAWRVASESGDISSATGVLEVPEGGMAAEMFQETLVRVNVAHGHVTERLGVVEVPAVPTAFA